MNQIKIKTLQKQNFAASHLASGTHDGNKWDLKNFSVLRSPALLSVTAPPPSLSLGPAPICCFHQWTLPLLGVSSIPRSNGVLALTFTALSSGLSRTPLNKTDPALYCQAQAALCPWSRSPSPSVLHSVRLGKRVPCGWCCQGLLPAWAVAWLIRWPLCADPKEMLLKKKKCFWEDPSFRVSPFRMNLDFHKIQNVEGLGLSFGKAFLLYQFRAYVCFRMLILKNGRCSLSTAFVSNIESTPPLTNIMVPSSACCSPHFNQDTVTVTVTAWMPLPFMAPTKQISWYSTI